mgnify:CR=1 FL=1
MRFATAGWTFFQVSRGSPEAILEHHGWAAAHRNHYVKFVATNINVFRVVCGRGCSA